jgi:uncharacterized protein YjaZ
MNIQLHLLLGSKRLVPFSNIIKDNFEKALPFITSKIPIIDVDVVIYDNPEGTVEEQGIGGYTPNAHLVYIPMNPEFPNLHNSINTELKRTLAHELHHALRWQNPGYGETLLDSLITEGLADHFDIEVFNQSPQPWSIAFSDSELSELMKQAEKDFQNKEYDHYAWFYGNEELKIPRWAGYSLGFKIVKDYLQKYPGKKPSQLYSATTNDFVK